MIIGIDGRAAKWYRGTGIGTYTYELINSLNKIDKINKYYLFMPEKNKGNINLNKNFNIVNTFQNTVSNFWEEINSANDIYNTNMNLYHIPQNGIGIPLRKKCPFIITLHDIIPYRMPETVSSKYLKIFTEEMPKIISSCDGIITVSDFSKKDIIKSFNFPEDKIFVTHLASENIYMPLSKRICKYFIEKNYSIHGNFILYVGSFSPRKNITGLIESFSKFISKTKKDIKLVIAGKQGISYDNYKKRSIELKVESNVIFPGFIPIEHMPYLYNAADLFVYPSFYEGFGLPLLEAMSCGVPVITSDATSIPEVVEDAAVKINPYDIDDMSNAIYEVYTNPDLRKNLISKGLLRAMNFSWDETARKTLDSYKQIAKCFS